DTDMLDDFPKRPSKEFTMPTFPEYCQYDAIGLAELIRSQQISRHEVLEAAISRLETINPTLNVASFKDYDRARASVTNASGAFAGVPFLTKDTNDLQGAPSTWGSALFKDAVAPHTDTLNQRYQDAGLVIFGKTIC